MLGFSQLSGVSPSQGRIDRGRDITQGVFQRLVPATPPSLVMRLNGGYDGIRATLSLFSGRGMFLGLVSGSPKVP
jgi:hypothetical protein